MGKLLKIGVPMIAIVGLGVFAWMFLEQSGNSGAAEKTAGRVFNAADKAISTAVANLSEQDKTERFVNVGAIYTSRGNLSATLVVRGSAGMETVCNRLIHVRDFLVVLLSDYPPDPANPGDGPSGYRGSIVTALNELAETEAIQRVRFDSWHAASDPGRSGC